MFSPLISEASSKMIEAFTTCLANFNSRFEGHNSHTQSYRDITPNAHDVWVKRGTYAWLSPMSMNQYFQCLGRFMHHIMHCFLFIACFFYKFLLLPVVIDLTFLVLFLSVFKIQKPIKIEKSSKSLITCSCVYHIWVWPSAFVLMA